MFYCRNFDEIINWIFKNLQDVSHFFLVLPLLNLIQNDAPTTNPPEFLGWNEVKTKFRKSEHQK